MLSLKVLNAEVLMTTDYRHGTVHGTFEINQPRYFKNALILKRKLKMCFFEVEVILLFPQETKCCGLI